MTKGLPGTFEALLLIALGIGYIVLYFAKREEKSLQLIGYFIGSLIIVLACIYTIGNLWLNSSTRVNTLQSKSCPKCAEARRLAIQRMLQLQQQKQQPMPSAPAQ